MIVLSRDREGAVGSQIISQPLERAGIRYAVGGSCASTAFGEPRFTNDVDILAEFTAENLVRFLRFPLGTEELNRAISLTDTGLSKAPARFVTPEDILLAKLYWFSGKVSQLQWRDIQGVVRACAATLDHGYLQAGAVKLGVRDLLHRVLGEA